MVILATKTMAAINDAIKADQGSAFREHQGRVLPHMRAAYDVVRDGGYRQHLGASIIGRECERAIWYSFRWATKQEFEGETLRLFNTGHLYEGRCIAMLLTIGCKVYQQAEDGSQFHFNDGHFGGSCDGIVIGIPDLNEDAFSLVEYKTHNDHYFNLLKKKGMRETHFEHFAQMQVYMDKFALETGLYFAVNKNTDEIYIEIIHRDIIFANKFVERAHKIIFSQDPPGQIHSSPGYYKCKLCDHRPICHKIEPAIPQRNCRTCAYSAPKENRKWECVNPIHDLLFNEQIAGCNKYTLRNTI